MDYTRTGIDLIFVVYYCHITLPVDAQKLITWWCVFGEEINICMCFPILNDMVLQTQTERSKYLNKPVFPMTRLIVSHAVS